MNRLKNVLIVLSLWTLTSCSGTGTHCPDSPVSDDTPVSTSPQESTPDETQASPVSPVPASSNIDLRQRTYDVLVENGLVIRGGSIGVSLATVEGPSSPRELGRVVLPGSAQGLVLARPGLLAVGCGGEGVFLLDISSPSAPRNLGHMDTDGAVWRLRQQGDHILAADGPTGLAILRIDSSGSSSSLREVGRWTSLGYVRQGEPWGVDRALVAEGRQGLAALELSDPRSPRLLSRLDTEGEVRAVHLRGEVAFVADFHPGVLAVDVSDPSHMTILGQLGTSDSARDVMVIGDILAVAIGTDGVLLVNISSPSSMEIVGRYETALPAVRFATAGVHLAVAADSGGAEIIDVSDPTRPRQVTAVR